MIKKYFVEHLNSAAQDFLDHRYNFLIGETEDVEVFTSWPFFTAAYMIEVINGE